MNVILNVAEFNSANVSLQPPIKNTVMDNSTFMRALYSTEQAVFTSIVCLVNIEMERQEKWFNKWKCTFDKLSNRQDAERLVLMEYEIMQLAKVSYKTPCYTLRDQIHNGHLKTFNQKITEKEALVIKICGIWETLTEYGLTYKLNYVQLVTHGL